MKRERYTFVVLRYRHDPVAGELLNVGVVVYAPESQFLGGRFRKAYGRLSKIYPDLDGSTLRHDLGRLEKEFERLAKKETGNHLLSSSHDAAGLAFSVVGKDDGSLVWSEMGSGIATSPKATLDRLFERYVTQYDDASVIRRTDAEIWRPFRDRLSELSLASALQSKTISTSKDEVQFEHAWKNGKWHCFQPLSFDMASADSIQEKAARWVGHMVGLSKAADEFQPYFIVGGPSDRELLPAYSRALDFLGDAPNHPQIVQEDNVEEFVDTLAIQMRANSH